MKNYKQPGDRITLTAPRNVLSGEVVVVGLVAGVAIHDALNGKPVEVATEGVYELAKTSAQAWATVGLPIYVIPSTGVVTTATTTGNVLLGTNLATAADPSAKGLVRLNGTVPAAAA